MIIRHMTFEHRSNMRAVHSIDGAYRGMSAGQPSTIVRAEFDLVNANELSELQSLMEHDVRLIPVDRYPQDDLAFALFALDHAGEEKGPKELAALKGGLRDLWAESDAATKRSYRERALLLAMLSTVDR